MSSTPTDSPQPRGDTATCNRSKHLFAAQPGGDTGPNGAAGFCKDAKLICRFPQKQPDFPALLWILRLI